MLLFLDNFLSQTVICNHPADSEAAAKVTHVLFNTTLQRLGLRHRESVTGHGAFHCLHLSYSSLPFKISHPTENFSKIHQGYSKSRK